MATGAAGGQVGAAGPGSAPAPCRLAGPACSHPERRSAWTIAIICTIGITFKCTKDLLNQVFLSPKDHLNKYSTNLELQGSVNCRVGVIGVGAGIHARYQPSHPAMIGFLAKRTRDFSM